MDGPEHLETGPTPGWGGTRWVVLGIVVLVVAGLALVRVAGLRDRTGPVPTAPPSPSPTLTTQGWPTNLGLPPGTLVVAAAGRVHTIDVGGGLVHSTRVEIDPGDGSMTPIGPGMLVVPGEGGRKQIVVFGSPSYPVGAALRSANTFLPGPDGTVWAATIDQREPAATNRWRQVDLDGKATTTVEVTGSAPTDGAGGLLAVDGDSFRQVYPTPAGSRQTGAVVAAGPDGYLMQRYGSCPGVLQDRAGHVRTDVALVMPGLAYGARLSAGNRLLALTVAGDEEDVVQVRAVASGRLLRTFPAAALDDHATVWLDDRWLVLGSEDQLVLYDAVEDRVVVPGLPLSSLGPLVWLPT